MVVDVDQLEIDNVPFAEQPNCDELDEEDEKPLIQLRTSPRTQLKQDSEQSAMEEDFVNNDDNEDDTSFGLNGTIGSVGQTSDDVAMNSLSEISDKAKSNSKSRSELKPKKREKATAKGKPKRIPLPEQLV